MDDAVFEKEIAMCRELSNKNGGKCAWGECEKCGVVPFLFKLCKGEIHEDPKDIKTLKDNIFGK